MIPKIIHYVWFGKKEKPDDIKRCMRTWKKKLPDYKFIEWNEDNFDIESHHYVKEAHKAKKWAYMSDYVRAKAIYDMGGIYLDTDVLVLESLDSLRSNRAFVGFENPTYPFTAVFGAEKGHPFVKDILDMYDNTEFEYDSNNEMKEVNTKTVSEILVRNYDCLRNNEYQELKDGLVVYPDTVLCNPSGESKTIHIFTGTWIEAKKPLKRNLVKFVRLRLTTRFRAEIYRKYFR